MKRYVKTLLAGLAVGGAAGFASLFWDDREYLLKLPPKKKPDEPTKAGAAEQDAATLLRDMVVVNGFPFGVSRKEGPDGKLMPVMLVPTLPNDLLLPSGEVRTLSKPALWALAKLTAKKFKETYGHDVLLDWYPE